MNYRQPELRDQLAAEYVLGTLHGRARSRFERLLLEDPLLRRDVERWEQHLGPLALSIPPQQPRKRVWRRIQRRIAPPASERTGWFWPLATGAATAAAAVLALYIVLVPLQPRPLEPDFVATIGAEVDGPRWSILADTERRVLTARAVRPADVPAGADFELWLLPGDDSAPISLGVLPATGSVERRLQADVAAAAPGAAGTAVSREPTGGSPTGAPTGPVLFTADVLWVGG